MQNTWKPSPVGSKVDREYIKAVTDSDTKAQTNTRVDNHTSVTQGNYHRKVIDFGVLQYHRPSFQRNAPGFSFALLFLFFAQRKHGTSPFSQGKQTGELLAETENEFASCMAPYFKLNGPQQPVATDSNVRLKNMLNGKKLTIKLPGHPRYLSEQSPIEVLALLGIFSQSLGGWT
jgi:hypothetical protein